ncbi:FHA domain-containing protein [Bogoriella caseilytica]|uniref:FHA domain-containing protein n=1 Tax=Bogoriella caseilytica TaxID=56055 RepID=A0A3N2BGR3_9MICO|nr:FHA domain-containing protein [Bogoriella caseilytica]ROR74442.1 FHA domain-containing protein [Bogoriella caseilytica]
MTSPQSPEDAGRPPERTDPTTTAHFGAISAEHEAAASPQEHHHPGLTSEEAAAVDGLPARSALLLVQRGPNAGARFLLDTEVTTAGRHPSSDIFLDDVTVSRKHAEFRVKDGGFEVRDVGSLNGTYVNRERIEQVVLRAGDEVQIGKYRLTYHPSPQGAGEA